MKTKKAFLRNLRENLKDIFNSLKEERIILLFSLLSFISVTLNIYDFEKKINLEKNKELYNLFSQIGLSFLLSSLFTINTAYFTKNLSNIKKYLIQFFSGLAIACLGFFMLRGFGNKVYGDLYFWGFFFTLILFTTYIFIPKNNTKTYFSSLIKHFFFTLLMASVFFGGGSLLITAFNNLIFNFDDFGEIYESFACFSYFVFGLNVFVYYLFYKREEESSGKAFKIIILYILLPVFFLLVALLYIYLIKALILFTFPKGQINWFVSFASCFYFVFYFVLKEYDDLPAVKFFYKFGAFAFIPLVCVQIPAYIIRLNAYGFTGWRFSSLMFIIFTVIMFTLTFIKKGKYINYSLLILAAIIIFSSLTPFNLINAAHKSQTDRLMKVLYNNQMFDKEKQCLTKYDKEILNQSISNEDREMLYSAYNYLCMTSSIPLPAWMLNEKGEKQRCFELFGIENTDFDVNIVNCNFTCEDKDPIDISTYKKMDTLYIRENSWATKNGISDYYNKKLDKCIIKVDDKEYDISSFILNYTEDYHGPAIIIPLDENIDIYIFHFCYAWNKSLKQFKDYTISGYFFWK